MMQRGLSGMAFFFVLLAAMLGSSVLFLPVLQLQSSLLSWLVPSLLLLYVAGCYAELAGMFPGGVYSYIKEAFGRFPAFLAGWMLLVAGHLVVVLAIQKLQAPLWVPFAMLFVVYAVIGISSWLGNVLLVTAGAASLVGIFASQSVSLPSFGFGETFILFGLAFFGLEAASFLAEAHASTAYGSIGLVMALAGLLAMFTSNSLFVIPALIALIIAWAVAGTRLVMNMAQDKLFFSNLGLAEDGTPRKAVAFQAALAFVVLFAQPGELALNIALWYIVVVNVVVLLAVTALRLTRPHYHRPYTVPFGRLLPLIVAVLGLASAYPVEPRVLPLGFSLLALGIPVYLFVELAQRHGARESAILSRLNLVFEDLLVSPRMRRTVLKLISPLAGKHVIEYGAGVGTLTLPLSKLAGKVTAVEPSRTNESIMRHRLHHAGRHVRLLHDSHFYSRVSPELGKADAIVSVGVLSALHDPKTIIKGLVERLQPGGIIAFADYDRFFDVLPNTPLICDDRALQRLFSEAGIAVSIVRRQGMAWKYVYVFGKKVEAAKKRKPVK
ncbi:methyltransferase domain-containing protein [Candidatus Woesearchaeota archaeon]|nr:methyltransferase domain-containing protein [Candidatus Woesearchaeota archaeon]